MESKAKLLGHSIHQMTIVFPLGLLGTSVIFDIAYLITRNGQWAFVAFWMIAAGLVGGLISAPFGTVDWLAIPAGTRAKRIGLIHGVGNVGVLLLFGIGWLVRFKAPSSPDMMPIALSWAGVILSLATAWLGGELVSRLSVGVDPGANLDAPSSLSGAPANATETPSQTSTGLPQPH